ncbi:hypothetical protein [Jatrophihabitans sp.]|uniref:hypothetical protein n=1 Tax=Jatrophihabitans sp. TaxID=1932789 RepID=UPI002B6B4C0B|nr:hypothetical protein [Jatrophihabitans sp.]
MEKIGRRTVLAAGAALLVAAGSVGYAEFRSSPAEADGGSRTSSPRAGGVDYAEDQKANFAASQLGQALLNVIPRFDGYAGLQILRYGIEVDTAGSPDPQLRAAVTRAVQRYRYQGREIEVRYRLVRYSERELKAVVQRIRADDDDLAKQGIELSSWGPDITTNKVEISLAHYTDAYRDVLLSRYGDLVTVTPHDVVIKPL